ncbi:MAG: hypothetical protein U0694_20605 [Anaerolineae bacterium]
MTVAPAVSVQGQRQRLRQQLADVRELCGQFGAEGCGSLGMPDAAPLSSSGTLTKEPAGTLRLTSRLVTSAWPSTDKCRGCRAPEGRRWNPKRMHAVDQHFDLCGSFRRLQQHTAFGQGGARGIA